MQLVSVLVGSDKNSTAKTFDTDSVTLLSITIIKGSSGAPPTRVILAPHRSIICFLVSMAKDLKNLPFSFGLKSIGPLHEGHIPASEEACILS